MAIRSVQSVKSVIRHYLLYARTLCDLQQSAMGSAVEEKWEITDFTDQTDREPDAEAYPGFRITDSTDRRGEFMNAHPLDASRVHFLTLSHDEQAAAIRRLASLGFGDHEIAQRTGWHVIEVRRALAEHRERIDFTYAR